MKEKITAILIWHIFQLLYYVHMQFAVRGIDKKMCAEIKIQFMSTCYYLVFSSMHNSNRGTNPIRALRVGRLEHPVHCLSPPGGVECLCLPFCIFTLLKWPHLKDERRGKTSSLEKHLYKCGHDLENIPRHAVILKSRPRSVSEIRQSII